MGRPHNTPDSYSPLLVDISIFDPVANIDRSLTNQKYLRSISVDSPTEGAWTINLVLFDPDFDVLEGYMFASQCSKRIVTLRWGWDQGRGLSRVPVVKGMVVKYEPTFQQGGVELNVEIVPATVVEAAVNKITRSFPQGKRYSEIVAEIAAQAGWITELDGVSTIEQTTGLSDKPLSTDDESAVRFIKEQIQGQSVNANGERFLFFFGYGDTDRVVHFHSRGFRKPDIMATYTFARDIKGDVISFAPQEASLFSFLQGGEAAIYTATNSKTGDRMEIETTREGGLSAVKIVSQPDENFVADQGSGIKARITIAARTQQEFEEQVAHEYNSKREVNYKATLEVRGTHAVRNMDFVTLRYLKRDGQEHYLSGTYQVLGIQHQVESGNWTTTFELARAAAGPVSGTKARERIKPDKTRTAEETVKTQGHKSQFQNNEAQEQTVRVPLSRGFGGGGRF